MRALQELDLVAFSVSQQHYALPLAVVERVLPMLTIAPIPRTPAVVLGLIDLHGETIPVFDLHARLHGAGGPQHYGVDGKLVVGGTSRRRFAVAAERVRGVVRVAAESLASLQTLVPGAGVLPDVVAGEEGLIYVHDPETLLTAREERQLAAALKDSAPREVRP